MLGEAVNSDPRKAIEVATLALRNLYPAVLRSWGMLITVTDDATAANNQTWVLTKGLVNTDKSDNSNWQGLTENLATSNYSGNTGLKFRLPVQGHQSSAGTSYGSEVIPSASIPNSTLLHVKAFVNGIMSDGSEGYAGEVVATFRKNSAGVLAIVGASASTLNEDLAIGGVVAALSAVANGVTLTVTIGGASGNWTQTAWLQMVQVTPT